MIKVADLDDLASVVKLANALWPNHTYEELRGEMKAVLLSDDAMIALFFDNNSPIAFAQCQLRNDYVEGTQTSPVGYLEGIYVSEHMRQKGIAKELLLACEKWAKEKGCTEFASDCAIDNMESYNFHLSVGFSEANRIICFNKKI